MVSPSSLAEALETLRSEPQTRIIAGGTDLIIQLKDQIASPPKLVNIQDLPELRYVSLKDGFMHLGALATFTDIINSQLAQEHAFPLVEACKCIGGVQIQNRGTIGGNLGNASPAADSLPPLFVLDAHVVAASAMGRRAVPISKFFLGPKKTVLKNDELILETYFKAMSPNESGTFLKLGLREANAIAIASVAVWVKKHTDKKRLTEARIALGAVAPTVVRAYESERLLTAKPVVERTVTQAARAAAEAASPITDIRASAEYRKKAIKALTFKALHSLLDMDLNWRT